MKTIFRYTGLSLLMAAIISVGALAGFAQTNPCEDATGMAELDAKFRENYNKSIALRKIAVEAGKQYIDKYGACGEVTADFVKYLKDYLPKMEAKIREDEAREAREKLYGRFDAGVKAKNWDEVYAVGKEILSKEPEHLDLMITLGSIGYDELYAGRTNFKYNDDTIRFAKQALAALDAGKTSKTFGLFDWSFKDKPTALAELNLTIGYITQVALKNKKEAAPYLYKVTQSGTAAAKNPIPYELIGKFYFDELNKIVEQIKTAEASQNEADTPEVAQKKVDDIKALVAMANGTAERAMDAFSRAFTNADPKAADYKKLMKQNVEAAYKLRFGKIEGVDSWIASVVSRPFPNPLSPIAPISDPEKTTSSADLMETPAAAPVTTVAVPKAKAPSTKAIAKKKGR